MQVEQRPLVSFCGQLRRVPATEWTLCALHGSAVVGGWCMFCRHEPCPKRRGGRMVAVCGSHSSRPTPHIRRGSSLILGTGALSHTMWSGSSIPFRLALVCRTLVPGPKNTFLTVCFRFASWTGQFSVVPCAMSIVFDATVHCVNVMSERDLGACYPLPCQLHPNSKFVV